MPGDTVDFTAWDVVVSYSAIPLFNFCSLLLVCFSRGGVTPIDCSHNCNRSPSVVNGQNRSKGCSQRSECAQKYTVYDQSALRSTENCRDTADLIGVASEVKGQRPKISAVNGQTAEKSWSRF